MFSFCVRRTKALLKDAASLSGEVKTLMIQLLRGVRHLHDNWILHRDLKTSNLLLSHKGILKVQSAQGDAFSNPAPTNPTGSLASCSLANCYCLWRKLCNRCLIESLLFSFTCIHVCQGLGGLLVTTICPNTPAFG